MADSPEQKLKEAPKFFLESASAQEAYGKAADLIEGHPSYKDRMGESPDFGVSMEQYVEDCRNSADEDYTAESPEEAQTLFEQYLVLLEQ